MLNPSSLFSFLDYTSLNATDSTIKMNNWLDNVVKVNTQIKNKYNLEFPAVCVFEPYVNLAKQKLSSTTVLVAAVAGAFPHGQASIETKINEIELLIKQGVDEIDFVISRAPLFDNDSEALSYELTQAKKACKNKSFKVILETGELDATQIAIASQLSIACGADFIKTSTGKATVNATPEAVEIMCKQIRTHYLATGKKVGIKIAGGVANANTALQYSSQIGSLLDSEWLNPHLFRIGASSLVNDLLKTL